ncbi:MAG: heme exporter protein CcmD [Pseudomonadota bacterium]
MYFESFSELLAMSGHGAYVWSAYAITGVVLVQLFFWPRRGQRRLLRELRQEARRRDGGKGTAAVQSQADQTSAELS